MSAQHAGDDAALYALGILEEDARLALDAHARECAMCAAALSAALDDVTALAEADVQHAPPPRFGVAAPAQRQTVPAMRPPLVRRFGLAAAAAIVIGLLPSTYFYGQNRAMHDSMALQDAALARISSAPHRVVAFAGSDAHVMYAPDGSWYCVIVNGTDAPVHVMWKHDGTMTDLGSTSGSGGTGMLYLPRSHRMDQLQLVRDGAIVADAKLVF